MDFSLSLVIAQIIGYLSYVVIIAAAVQTAVNQLKPLFLTGLKERLVEEDKENLYVVVIYVTRFIVTVIAYYSSVESDAVRQLLPSLSLAPDIFFMVLTVFLIVLGEEFIHEGMDRFSSVQAIIEIVEDISYLPDTSETSPASTTPEPTPTGEPLG